MGAILRVHVRARRQQRLHDLRVAILGRGVQRRPAVQTNAFCAMPASIHTAPCTVGKRGAIRLETIPVCILAVRICACQQQRLRRCRVALLCRLEHTIVEQRFRRSLHVAVRLAERLGER